MLKIEHLGIAVSDLEASEKLYSTLFATQVYKREVVESQDVTTSFLRCGPNKIELLSGNSSDSVISKFVDRKGEGLHHIAFAVADIVTEMNRLSAEGFQLLSDAPMPGADNKLVCFIHPKSANGVLIELVQENPH
jgi:methylmalonyl-CoA/ethylmalonyl-CoA epimerase